MNRFLTLAVVVSGLLLTAQAQSPVAYRIVTLVGGGTNHVAATATNTPAAVGVTCAEQDQVALFIEQRGTGAGSGNVIYAFAKGLDADSVETTPSIEVKVPFNGTNTVRLLSEPTLGGAGYLQLVSIQNTNAVALTNLTVKVSRKNPRRTVNLR